MPTFDPAIVARELYDAERSRRPLAPVSERFPGLVAADAYAVQEAYARLRMADGVTLVGRKIGLTSKAIQDFFKMDVPDYGHIFSDMVVADGGEIEFDGLIQPLVELEIAFLLDRPLAGPGVTRDDVLAASSQIAPCIEVIDSRITDWRIGFIDTVSDNGSSARAVFGPASPIAGRDLPSIAATMLRNGEPVASATGAAVLGHPADAVVWLANVLGGFGRGLNAGDQVLAGSFIAAIKVARGDRFEAVFDGLGSVSCRFR